MKVTQTLHVDSIERQLASMDIDYRRRVESTGLVNIEASTVIATVSEPLEMKVTLENLSLPAGAALLGRVNPTIKVTVEIEDE